MSATPQASALLFLRDDQLRQGLELLFFASRDLDAEADQIAADAGLAPAHRQILLFVGREPQITVGGLIAILHMTKQTVSRLVQDLVRLGLVQQRPGATDRRQRTLSLSEAGRALERKLWEHQRQRIARSWRGAGPEAVDGFRKVLMGLVESARDRRRFEPAASASPPPRGRG
jgi:DNA-binding MarR family transcriptional regulator